MGVRQASSVCIQTWYSPACPVIRLLGPYYHLQRQMRALTGAEADAHGYEIVLLEAQMAAVSARSSAGLRMQARLARQVAEEVDHATASGLLRNMADYVEAMARQIEDMHGPAAN